jgi:hypothetical protein
VCHHAHILFSVSTARVLQVLQEYWVHPTSISRSARLCNCPLLLSICATAHCCCQCVLMPLSTSTPHLHRPHSHHPLTPLTPYRSHRSNHPIHPIHHLLAPFTSPNHTTYNTTHSHHSFHHPTHTTLSNTTPPLTPLNHNLTPLNYQIFETRGLWSCEASRPQCSECR